MAFGKSFIDNPISKGHKIERREFYCTNGSRDEDFRNARKAVPFVIGGEPTAMCWWQKASDGTTPMIFTGVPMKPADQRIVVAPMGCDRKYYPGDADGTLIEGRAYRSLPHRNDMYLVCPPNQVPGFACMAWWEVNDTAKPEEGSAFLCTGLCPTADASKLAVSSGDGLETKSRQELLTQAGLLGIRDCSKDMPDGEIIAKIREKKRPKAKSEKTKEPVTV